MNNNKKNIVNKIENIVILVCTLILFILCFTSWWNYPKNITENTTENENENTTEFYSNTQEESTDKTEENTTEQKIEETEVKEIDITEPIEITQPEVEPIEQVYSVYSISAEEREMLAQLLYLEAGSTSYECQHMVAAVVFNRLSNGWGNTLTEVIYAEGQFTPAYLIGTVTPNSTQYEVIDDIIYNGHPYPSNLLCFRADYYFSEWGTPYTSIDNVYFSTL